MTHIALVGDSIYKYVDQHFTPGPGAPAIVFKSGAKIRDTFEMIDHLPDNITHIVLHVGTNDIHSNTVQTVREHTTELISHIQHTRPNTDITISQVLPRLPSGFKDNRGEVNELNRKADSFNKWLIEASRYDASGFKVTDHLQFRHNPAALLARDGLHPNFTGKRVMCNNLKWYLLHQNMYKLTLPKPPERSSEPKMVEASTNTNVSTSDFEQQTPATQTKNASTSTEAQSELNKDCSLKIITPTKHKKCAQPQGGKQGAAAKKNSACGSEKPTSASRPSKSATPSNQPVKPSDPPACDDNEYCTPVYNPPLIGATHHTTPTGRKLRSRNAKKQ